MNYQIVNPPSVRRWLSEQKKLSRSWSVDKWDAMARSALFLPAEGAYDVRESRDTGLTGAGTRLVLVEQREDVARQGRRSVELVGWKTAPYWHLGPISSLSLTGLLSPAKLDYANLDFCAAVTASRAAWMFRELGPMLSVGASLSYTFTRTIRNNLFMNYASKYFQTSQGRKEWQAANQLFQRARRIGSMQGSTRQAVAKGMHVVPSAFADAGAPAYHDSTLLALATLQGLLPYHEFVLDASLEYSSYSSKNGSRMGMLKIVELVPTSKPRSQLLADPSILTGMCRHGLEQR